jgi:superfamily II DNA helicase RecQ
MYHCSCWSYWCHGYPAFTHSHTLYVYLFITGQGQKTILEAFSGRYSIVYLTPEMLPSCLDAITQLHHGGNGAASEGVCLLAVDEAHCISQWGQDFRAAFMSINCFRDTPALAHIPLMALTATAVPRVQADIKKSLRMSDDCLDSITSVDRYYCVCMR